VTRGRGRPLAPQVVDQAVDRDDVVGVQEQDREERAPLRAPERKRLAVAPDLEGSEHSEVEPVRRHCQQAKPTTIEAPLSAA
jgi:hypothetical protein